MANVERHFARGLVACEGRAEIGTVVSRPWASVTFQGQVVTATLIMPTEGADRIAERIAEHEFAIPGHIVADAAVMGRDDRPATSVVVVEALVIEAA